MRGLRRPLAGAACVLVLWLAFGLAGCGVRTRVSHEMRWQVEQRESEQGRYSEVVLTFVEFPDYQVGVVSDELVTHLERTGKPTVTAEFELTHDLWRLRGYSLLRVDGLGVSESWGGYVDSGGDGRSPWE